MTYVLDFQNLFLIKQVHPAQKVIYFKAHDKLFRKAKKIYFCMPVARSEIPGGGGAKSAPPPLVEIGITDPSKTGGS